MQIWSASSRKAKGRMKGQLVILATGCTMVDLFGSDAKLSPKKDEQVEELIRHLDDGSWHLTNSIFVDTYQLFDCRNSQTKTNTKFCAKVFGALELGASILIVIPEANMVDKRLRDKAMIFSLPKGENGST